jgi:hypothetical protein
VATDLVVVYSLIAVNVILYGLMLLGYVRGRKGAGSPGTSPTEAFAFLESSFKSRFPNVREGFTWSEVISKAKSDNPSMDVNWRRIETAVDAYEAYRYGQTNKLDFDAEEIVKLGNLLHKKKSWREQLGNY